MTRNIFDDASFFTSYMDIRLKADGHNELIEKPALISLLPEVDGSVVLDLGCGHGDLCRYLLSRGAQSVLGIDVSSEMIKRARSYPNQENVRYLNQDMSAVEAATGTYDLVTSSLAIHYVEDYAGLISKIHTLLKPGGHLVFSIEHPIYSAPAQGPEQAWAGAVEGRRDYWKLDAYGHEGKRVVDWLVAGVEKYHRKTETYINVLIGQGFKLDALLEPCADARIVAGNPALAYEVHRPPFLLMRAQKTY